MGQTPYITNFRDLDGYEGPIDCVSTYAFYVHKYWSLRQRWRRWR